MPALVHPRYFRFIVSVIGMGGDRILRCSSFHDELEILASHQELVAARIHYLAPFTPPSGAAPTLSYICQHLKPELRAYVQPYQEALKSLALAIKSSQARNQEFALNAQQIIRATRKRLEDTDPQHQRKTYTAKGKMNIQVPRGRGYGKG